MHEYNSDKGRGDSKNDQILWTSQANAPPPLRALQSQKAEGADNMWTCGENNDTARLTALKAHTWTGVSRGPLDSRDFRQYSYP